MNIFSLKKIMSIFLVIGLICTTLAFSTDDAFANTAGSHSNSADIVLGATPHIRVLPADVSRSLKLTSIPTQEPLEINIGTYWDCSNNSQGFEICDIRVVACTDDQETCVEIP